MPLTISLFDEGLPPPCPERFNLARHSVMGPAADDRAALTVLGPHDADVWSFGRLREAVLRAAGGLLAEGLAPGDRVMLRVGDEPLFPILFFAVIAAGGVAMPVSTMLTARELSRMAEDSDPSMICAPDGVDLPGRRVLARADLERVAAWPPVEIADTGRDDPAFIVFTSGTGGRPKGVVHAQRAGWARRMMWRGWYGLRPDDLVLHAGAFNWTYTLGAGLMDPWAAGAGTLIVSGDRRAEVWSRVARERRPTIFAAVPGVYRQLLRETGDARADFASLRHGLTAGERLPEALREAWTAATGKPLYEALGMSEVSTYISASPETPSRPGRVGRPQPGRRVSVLGEDGRPAPVGAVGRLAVSSRDPGLMLGYFGGGLPLADEWFVTGDLAEMDADGYIAHRGRDDEVMNALGYRVSPQEVEEALAGCPGVAEVAVGARRVREDVEVIAAYVVPSGAPPTLEALRAWCETRLAAYKRPKALVLVEKLPRNPNGKLRRRELAALG